MWQKHPISCRASTTDADRNCCSHGLCPDLHWCPLPLYLYLSAILLRSHCNHWYPHLLHPLLFLYFNEFKCLHGARTKGQYIKIILVIIKTQHFYALKDFIKTVKMTLRRKYFQDTHLQSVHSSESSQISMKKTKKNG